MPEQRNPYKGSPVRPWIRVVLVADDGATRELQLLADTGNPCAVIIDTDVMRRFNQGVAPGMNTNFGRLEAGWLRVQIPDIHFDEDVLGYSSQLVVTSAQGDHPDFEGLAGLPLLRLTEYGGDRDSFWVRTP